MKTQECVRETPEVPTKPLCSVQQTLVNLMNFVIMNLRAFLVISVVVAHKVHVGYVWHGEMLE